MVSSEQVRRWWLQRGAACALAIGLIFLVYRTVPRPEQQKNTSVSEVNTITQECPKCLSVSKVNTITQECPKCLACRNHSYTQPAILSLRTIPTRLKNPNRLFNEFSGTVSPDKMLLPAKSSAANVVHMVWCGKDRLFRFKHMLTVLSALKIHQPIRVIMHYWFIPATDLYNDWLQQLTSTFFNFELVPIGADFPFAMPGNCRDAVAMGGIIQTLLTDTGGVYLDDSTIMTKSAHAMREEGTLSVRIFEQEYAIVTGRGFTKEDLTTKATVQHTKSCVTVDEYDAMTTTLSGSNRPPIERGQGVPAVTSDCVFISKMTIIPRDFHKGSGPFSSLVRKLYYGTSDPIKPKYDMTDPIPNIGHFYLLHENKVNLFIYLSLYSLLSVAKVDRVYVHGDIEPTGAYWTKLTDTGKVTHVYCPPLDSVFGKKIGDNFHGKDVLSVYLLYIYGGIFIDWDAVVTRPLGHLRGYDAVVGKDWFIPPEGSTFPELINCGVLAAKKHSPFLSMWLDYYKEFGKGGFYYTGLMVPYKLFEKYPETVYIDDRFQVICWKGTCKPPWLDGYQRDTFHSLFDFHKVFAVHFTYPDPVEFYTEEALFSSDTFYGKIGKHIMGNRTLP